MKKEDFEKMYGVLLVNKKDSPLMIILHFLLSIIGSDFMNGFFTTWRLPFQKKVRIGYPPSIKDPLSDGCMGIMMHELVHAEDLKKWYGPIWYILFVTIFPLPVFFSGRWFVERRAYLQDIRLGRIDLNAAIDTLWSGYGWAWPKKLMRRWFEKRLK